MSPSRKSFLLSRLAAATFGSIVPLVAIAFPVIGAIDNGSASWTTTSDEIGTPKGAKAGLPDGVSLDSLGEVRYSIADATVTQQVAALLPDVLTAAFISALAWLVFILLERVAGGAPFSPSGAGMLRTMGLSAAVAGILIPLTQTWADSVLSDAVGGRGGVETTFPFAWFGLALLLLALSEVFWIGTRLAQDTEGLV
jgi:hypothetical protein